MTRHHTSGLNRWLMLGAGLLTSLGSQAAPLIDSISNGQCQPTASGSWQQQIDIGFSHEARNNGFSQSDDLRHLQIDLLRLQPLPADAPVMPLQHQNVSTPLQDLSYRDNDTRSGALEITLQQGAAVQVQSNDDLLGLRLLIDCQPPASASDADEQQASELMQQARKALIDERNFSLAADLYRQVQALPDNRQSANAREYEGLALERQGLRSEAIQRYQDYLQRYPDGEGHQRVAQRLQSLGTATDAELPALRQQPQEEPAVRYDLLGSLDELWIQDQLSVDGGSAETTAHGLYSNLDLNFRRRSSASSTRLRLNAGQYHNLLNDGNPDQGRLNQFYGEYQDHELGWNFKLGRMSTQHDGTLGRYDGIRVGINPGRYLGVNLVAGRPLDSSEDPLFGTSERRFYGASVDLGPWNADDRSMGMSLYAIQQNRGSLIDRQATGLELRYFRPGLTLLGQADYDTRLQSLNFATLMATTTFAGGTTLSSSLDQRRQPLLNLGNAMIGQFNADGTAVTRSSELQALYSNAEIDQLVLDRSAMARTASLGLSVPFSERWRWNSDVSVSSTDATVASAGVEAIPASGSQYFFSSQLTASGLLGNQDISNIGLRGSRTDLIRSNGLYFNSRLYSGEHWRLYPSLGFDRQQWLDGSQTQTRLAPRLRADWQLDNIQLNAEISSEWRTSRFSDSQESSRWNSISVGFRYDFQLLE